MLGALILGAILWIYGRDLPKHEQLAQYAPPTISRVYSNEGALIDEFSVERRLFAPSSEIPDLIKQAFISAEDKNFYTHQGYDPVGMASAIVDMAQGGRLRGGRGGGAPRGGAGPGRRAGGRAGPWRWGTDNSTVRWS